MEEYLQDHNKLQEERNIILKENENQNQQCEALKNSIIEKEHEIQSLLNEIKANKEKLEENLITINKLQEKRNTIFPVNEKKENTNQQNEALKNLIIEKDHEIESVLNESKANKEKLEALKNLIIQKDQEIENILIESKANKAKLEHSSIAINQLQEEKSILLTKTNEAENEALKSLLSEKDKEIEFLLIEPKETKEKLEQNSITIAELQEEIARISKELVTLSQENAALKEENARFLENLKEKSNIYKEFETQVKFFELKIQDLQGEKAVLMGNQQNAESLIKVKDKKLHVLKEENASLSKKIKEMQENLAVSDEHEIQEKERVIKEMQRNCEDLSKANQELLHKTKEFEQKIKQIAKETKEYEQKLKEKDQIIAENELKLLEKDSILKRNPAEKLKELAFLLESKENTIKSQENQLISSQMELLRLQKELQDSKAQENQENQRLVELSRENIELKEAFLQRFAKETAENNDNEENSTDSIGNCKETNENNESLLQNLRTVSEQNQVLTQALEKTRQETLQKREFILNEIKEIETFKQEIAELRLENERLKGLLLEKARRKSQERFLQEEEEEEKVAEMHSFVEFKQVFLMLLEKNQRNSKENVAYFQIKNHNTLCVYQKTSAGTQKNAGQHVFQQIFLGQKNLELRLSQLLENQKKKPVFVMIYGKKATRKKSLFFALIDRVCANLKRILAKNKGNFELSCEFQLITSNKSPTNLSFFGKNPRFFEKVSVIVELEEFSNKLKEFSQKLTQKNLKKSLGITETSREFRVNFSQNAETALSLVLLSTNTRNLRIFCEDCAFFSKTAKNFDKFLVIMNNPNSTQKNFNETFAQMCFLSQKPQKILGSPAKKSSVLRTVPTESSQKTCDFSLKRLKSLENNEVLMGKKISFLEKQVETVRGKMKSLLLNIKKIANDSIHRKSKRNLLRIPTTTKIERQTTYIQKIIDQTEYLNLNKISRNIFAEKGKNCDFEMLINQCKCGEGIKSERKIKNISSPERNISAFVHSDQEF